MKVRHFVSAGLAVSICFVGLPAQADSESGQAQQTSRAVAFNPSHPGSWQVVADCTVNGVEVNPIHTMDLPSGRVLLLAGSGYKRAYFEQKIFKAWVYDPRLPAACPHEVGLPTVGGVPKDLFCAGHVHLPDGRPLFFGGTADYAQTGSLPGSLNYFKGIREAFTFDEASETFTQVGSMAEGRWYPNGPVNAAGAPIAVAGLDEQASYAASNEVFSPTSKTWSTLPGSRAFPMYPGMVLTPRGSLAYVGSFFHNRHGMLPQDWLWPNNTSTAIPSSVGYPDCRDQAATIVVWPRVVVAGGGCPAGVTGTTYQMDLSKPLAISAGPYLGYAAQHVCGLALPDKSMFVAGGGNHNLHPQLHARKLSHNGTAWQALAAPSVPRMYHSTCTVLRDGRVLTMGTNHQDGSVESRFEIFTPNYAQPGVVRPVITGTNAGELPSGTASMAINGSYTVSYVSPSAITGATLRRLNSQTHSMCSGCVLVPLTVSSAGIGKVNVQMPPSWAHSPLGVYELALLDSRGVPSVTVPVEIRSATITPRAPSKTTALHPFKVPAGCCCC